MAQRVLPYGSHTIDEHDIRAVLDVLRSPLITQGPLVESFEKALGDYLEADHVSVCASGTAALHLAYTALGIGPGDEIITSSITFAATATAARWLGAEVRFADVEPDTGNLNAESVASLITARTRAIVAVHLGGLPAEMDRLRALADRHGLWLIEDAAHALGATFRGRNIGSGTSDAATFSFHPVKHITTAEGGAIVVADSELKRSMDRLRHHGIEREPCRMRCAPPGPWYYELHELGFNYRLSDIQCALGLSQLTKQRQWLARRRDIAAMYRDRLARRFGHLVVPQAERPDRESAYHLFPVLIDFAGVGVSRARLMAGLQERGIGTQVHYLPLGRHPYFRDRYGGVLEGPGTGHYYERTLSLPMYPTLALPEVDRVVEALAKELGCDAPRPGRSCGE